MLTEQQIRNKNKKHDLAMKRTLVAHMPERYFQGKLEREFDENERLVKLNWERPVGPKKGGRHDLARD